jgi:hypothetical protein
LIDDSKSFFEPYQSIHPINTAQRLSSTSKTIVSSPNQIYHPRSNTPSKMAIRASRVTFNPERQNMTRRNREWHIQMVASQAPSWAYSAVIVCVLLLILIERLIDMLQWYNASEYH